MSSILKALQKLEQDKETRKTREPDISSAIKMSGVRSKEYPAWLVPCIVVTVAAVSILVTFSLMGGFSSHKGSTLQTVQQSVQPQQSPEIIQQPVPAASSRQSLLPPEQVPFPNPPVRVPPAGKPLKIPVPAAPSPHESSAPSLPGEPTVSAPETTQDERQPEITEEKPAAKPKLTVSGIAWQKDSASRIAVVNGSPVSEGSSVGGAKVEQIFPDRVKFFRGGTSFELFLNQEN